MKQNLQLVIPHKTPAICHAAKIFFEDVCGFAMTIVEQKKPIDDSIIIVYDYIKTGEELFLNQHSINSNESVIESATVEIDGAIFPFACSSDSFMPFDPIALAWNLMLFPDEQMKKCSFDHHHRPESADSWLVKNNQHRLPLIDIAKKVLFEKLKQMYPSIKLPKSVPFFESTFDIDIAFAHKAKSFLTHGLGTASLAIKGNVSGLNNRIKVWRKIDPDPYDVFDELLDELDRNGVKAVFFAMTANRSKYDKNNHYQSKDYRNLLKRIAQKHTVGLHPGYRAAQNPAIFKTEKIRLEGILDNQITYVRQHYLRQFLPEMWQTYQENDILHDYSIGYAVREGFKVGTCAPYQAFDVVNNQSLPIIIHPFALMDTALWRNQKMDYQEVLEVSNEIKAQIVMANSSLSAVWHNYAMPRQSIELKVFKQQVQLFNSHD